MRVKMRWDFFPLRGMQTELTFSANGAMYPRSRQILRIDAAVLMGSWASCHKQH